MEKDLVGVGVGPANLSLAALITSARERGLISIKSTFLERNPAIFWHSGQLFPGTLMQTEFYRDLVTPIDPTSRFSFLNYLRSNARLDQFLCSSSIWPTRREFEDYFNWVANQIADIIFATTVQSVEYDPETNLFIVEAEHGSGSHSPTQHKSRHIVLGSGSQPNSTIAGSRVGRVVDVSALLRFDFPNPSQRILVIGGGQSAAECINYLLDRYANVEMLITWLTRDTSFRALDKGNFSRETYSVSYGHAFALLPRPLREKIMRDDRSVANGITPEIAVALYQRLYSLKYLSSPGGPSVHMQSNTEVLEVRDEARGALVTARALATGQTSTDVYDCAILCTGFDNKTILESSMIGAELRRRISKNETPDGYAIAWDGPPDRKIFVQSQNGDTHGLGDVNFITAPARNASILNSIAGEEIYKIDNDDRLVALG